MKLQKSIIFLFDDMLANMLTYKYVQKSIVLYNCRWKKIMNNDTFDLDDYISQRKEKDSDFANGFDSGYEEFKIGMMIKEMRLENGMTQEQLAEKLNTKKSVISRMENHSEDIRLSTLQKVAAVFGKQLRVAML